MINDVKTMDENIQKIWYDEAFDLVKAEINNTLSKSPIVIREYTKHLLASQGKYIRAASVLICAEDKEGMIHPDAVKIAASIEILHLATLVHDDVIDNADLRRGNITLQKKYGKRTAVICGDYLLSVSLRMAASISNRQDFLNLNMPDYVEKVCLGELNQHINNYNVNLTFFNYLKIISGKTAALFEASFFAGALFTGISEAEAKKYRKLGNYIGMIFQLTDDCIDFENTVETANKPVQSDYEQGVITLPLIHALKQLGDFRAKAQGSGVSRSEINEAVSKTGGLDFTRLIVRKYYNKSMKIVDDLDITDNKKDKLIMLLNKASRTA
ncbi:MAG: Polyprenyl synthetase [Herbinix sp.]|jgi:heptaprenyl diphosphate synthase|nr:Polyprenyl synthetase [Herbinix sp.]